MFSIFKNLDQDVKYIVFAVAVIIVSIIISAITRRLINIFVRKRSLLLKVDPTKFSFIKNALSAIIYTGAVITIFIRFHP